MAAEQDELFLFFKYNAIALKLNNSAAIENIYKKVKGKIEYEDLMEWSTDDLKDGLKECGISSAIKRNNIVKVVKKIKEAHLSSNNVLKQGPPPAFNVDEGDEGNKSSSKATVSVPPQPYANSQIASQQSQNDDEKETKHPVDHGYEMEQPESPEERKLRLSRERANLSGEVLVPHSLNKSALDASKPNRCILVIGATGTGKTTCLNSMMNYLFEVEYNDKFRYKLIMEDKNANHAKSQTKEVTAYYLNPLKLDYSVTLVDTPGYGDTVGITEDDVITTRIKNFFDKEIQSIDAVCFVIRAPQARLEATQKYVFNKVLEVFGKDIKDNIFILFTFADHQRPPALAGIKEAKIPYKQYFKLNNSGFFDLGTEDGDDHKSGSGADDDSSDEEDDVFGSGYWDMGMKAFDKFFKKVSKVQPQSLTLTRMVLSRRQQLQNYIIAIQPAIDKTYGILESMRTSIYQVKTHAAIVNSSKNYEFKVIVPKSRRIPVQDGRNTTTCLNCSPPNNYTCHHRCCYKDNTDKRKCCAMDRNGACTVCPGHCDWSLHKNMDYTVEQYTVEETKTIEDLKKKYYDAKNKQSASDQIIAGLTEKLVDQQEYLNDCIDNVRRCIIELREIALQPNIMNKDDYIDQIIESEKAQRKAGWQSRVKSLNDLKKRDRMIQGIDKDDHDDLKSKMQFNLHEYKDVYSHLKEDQHLSKVYADTVREKEKKKKQKEEQSTGIYGTMCNIYSGAKKKIFSFIS